MRACVCMHVHPVSGMGVVWKRAWPSIAPCSPVAVASRLGVHPPVLVIGLQELLQLLAVLEDWVGRHFADEHLWGWGQRRSQGAVPNPSGSLRSAQSTCCIFAQSQLPPRHTTSASASHVHDHQPTHAKHGGRATCCCKGRRRARARPCLQRPAPLLDELQRHLPLLHRAPLRQRRHDAPLVLLMQLLVQPPVCLCEREAGFDGWGQVEWLVAATGRAAQRQELCCPRRRGVRLREAMSAHACKLWERGHSREV